MEKMRMESADMIEKNIKVLADIFPGCVTEALDEKKSKHTHVSLYFAIVAAFAILSLFSSWLGIQDTVTNQLNNISQAVAESIE